MKCQILFSGKNKKNIINLPSAENAQRVVKVNKVIADLAALFHCTRNPNDIQKYICWVHLVQPSDYVHVRK